MWWAFDWHGIVNVTGRKAQPDSHLVTVSRGVILGADDQAPTLLRAAVDRFDDIDQLLFVLSEDVSAWVTAKPHNKELGELTVTSSACYYYQFRNHLEDVSCKSTIAKRWDIHIICLFLKKNCREHLSATNHTFCANTKEERYIPLLSSDRKART